MDTLTIFITLHNTIEPFFKTRYLLTVWCGFIQTVSASLTKKKTGDKYEPWICCDTTLVNIGLGPSTRSDLCQAIGLDRCVLNANLLLDHPAIEHVMQNLIPPKTYSRSATAQSNIFLYSDSALRTFLETIHELWTQKETKGILWVHYF